MALGQLTITLNPGVDPEEFETFAADELFPAARTVIPSRIGRVRVRHTLLREHISDDERAPRTYLWRVEQHGFDSGSTRAEGYRFATDIGADLKAKLSSFGNLDFGIAEERFGRIIAQSDDELSTPTEGSDESDPQGWVTPRPERLTPGDPPMTDATTIPPHLGKLGAPTGKIPTTLRIAFGRGAPWADVNRHDPFHAKYGVRFGVRPSMLKAMEVIESGGKSIPNGSGFPNFGVMQLTHSWNGGPKTKWERVAQTLGLPFREPEGQIAVAAYVLGGHDNDQGTPEEIFLDKYYPTECLDCPGPDGHTPRQYLADMKDLERLITAAATSVSPSTPTPVLFPRVRVFHVPAGVTATAREAPNRGSPVVMEFEPGTAISSDGYYIGEEIGGEARWLRTSESPHLAIHESGVSEPIVEDEDPAMFFAEEGPAIVFGNVPDPGINIRIIDKPELAGWNDRGARNIVGVCVHRMLGTLQGTEGHFSTRFDQAGNPNPGWRALTDFGIGGEMDPGLNGAIWQWNPLSGNRSPWANGWADGEDPWVVTEGHGREFLQTWIPQGYDLNRDLASIELSGCSTGAPWCGGNETPVTPAQLESLSHLIAYVCDRFCQISYEDFPFNPRVGPDFYAVYQHYEFAGKDCPFPTVKALHGTYVERAREIMKLYQADWAPEFTPFGGVRTFTVLPNVRASGRQAPSRGATLVRSFEPGLAIECDGVFTGETVQGEPRWLRTSSPQHLAIHASAFVEAP